MKTELSCLENILTSVQQRQLQFWDDFRKYLKWEYFKEKHSYSQLPKLGLYHLNEIIFHHEARFKIAVRMNTLNRTLAVHLFANDYFDKLYERKGEIEGKMRFELTWNKDKKHLTKVPFEGDFSLEDKSRWPEYFSWLKERAEKMLKVLGPIIDELQKS